MKAKKKVKKSRKQKLYGVFCLGDGGRSEIVSKSYKTKAAALQVITKHELPISIYEVKELA